MDNENEIWKSIPGFPGYEVSNMGRVKSYKRKKPTILKPGTTNGYRFVNLRQNDKSVNKRVAYLVLLSFVGPRPAGMDVCHGNDIKTDDRLDNLRYDTHKRNLLDAVKNNGGVAPNSKITKAELKTIKELLPKMTIPEIEAETGISINIIRSVSGRYSHTYVDITSRTEAKKKRADKIRELYATGNFTMQQLADDFKLSISGVSRIVNHQRMSEEDAIYPLRDNKPGNWRSGESENRVQRDKKVLLSLNDIEKQALDNISDFRASNATETLRFLIQDYAQSNNMWPMGHCPDCGLTQIEQLNDINRRCNTCGLHFSVERVD